MVTVAVTVGPIITLMLTSKESHGPGKSQAKTSGGKAVPKDVARRKAAKSEVPSTRNATDRKLQLLLLCALVVPQLACVALQESPTVGEQLSLWARLSWEKLTDRTVEPSFQLAAALLFLERLTYTWVHTFTASFAAFCKTPLGRCLGKEPLDTVLTLFYINKARRPRAPASRPPLAQSTPPSCRMRRADLAAHPAGHPARRLHRVVLCRDQLLRRRLRRDGEGRHALPVALPRAGNAHRAGAQLVRLQGAPPPSARHPVPDAQRRSPTAARPRPDSRRRSARPGCTMATA